MCSQEIVFKSHFQSKILEYWMKSSKPYFIRAVYDWLTDNHVTPHLLIDAGSPGLKVPDACEIDDDNQIVLNISFKAVRDLVLGIDDIIFQASFNHTVHEVQIPVYSIKAIYCTENGQGMYFDDEEDEPPSEDRYSQKQSNPKKNNQKPFLKIVE